MAMGRPRTDRTGQRSGRLVAKEFHHVDNGGNAYWLCVCDCGNKTIVNGQQLGRGTKSCGCLRRPHGYSRRGSPTYNAWRAAKARCTNSDHPSYRDYGGRGIEFRLDSVLDLIADIGEKPETDEWLSIDRIDNDGHYEIGNIRWANRKTQNNNTRRTARNRPVEVSSG